MMMDAEQVKLISSQEAFARASCMEYECNQGDYTFLARHLALPTSPTNLIELLHDDRHYSKDPKLYWWHLTTT